MTPYRDDPPIIVKAKLRGVARTKGHERECRVQVIMRHHYIDEQAALARFDPISIKIVDTDNFPEGDYEVEFVDGSKKNLRRKKNGRYYGR